MAVSVLFTILAENVSLSENLPEHLTSKTLAKMPGGSLAEKIRMGKETHL
jgi:predicted metal-binding protein